MSIAYWLKHSFGGFVCLFLFSPILVLNLFLTYVVTKGKLLHWMPTALFVRHDELGKLRIGSVNAVAHNVYDKLEKKGY